MTSILAILAALAFDTLSVHFEQNASDGDVEVVFAVKGGDEGLRALRVLGPDGRRVADFRAPDASTLGIRQFDLESPEPADTERLRAAYPEGRYRFEAETAGGVPLAGEATLSHALPPPGTLLSPAPGAVDVPLRGLVVRWEPVADVAGYVVEIEHDELGFGLEVRLPASATRLAVPDQLLAPATEYELQLGTVARNGNTSFVETSFTTGD